MPYILGKLFRNSVFYHHHLRKTIPNAVEVAPSSILVLISDSLITAFREYENKYIEE